MTTDNPIRHERHRLAMELRVQAQRVLGLNLGSALDKLDVELFEAAANCRGGAEQQRLFDGMRELRRQRTAVEHRFISAVGEAIALPNGAGSRSRRRESLSLVDQDVLDEELAMSAIASSAAGKLHGSLYALNRRLGELLGSALDDDSNPLGPAALLRAFQFACAAMDIDADLRLRGFRQFDHHVLAPLDRLYADLSQRLVTAGVLPELVPELTRGAEPVDAPAAATKSETALPADATPRSVEDGATAPAPVGADPLSADLLRLLHALRTRPLEDPPARAPAAAAWGSRPRPSRQLGRDELRTRLEVMMRAPPLTPSEAHARLLGNGGQDTQLTMDPDCAGTIKLVDSLFERMLADQQVPSALQPALAGMHLPLLDLVLHDREVLSDGQHPARQLLETFETGTHGWCPSADPGMRLPRHLQSCVQKLREAAQEGKRAFERVLDEVRGFLEAQRLRAEADERRAIEGARSREALHRTRVSVHSSLQRRLAAQSVSPWLQHMLLRHWSGYLVLTAMRGGEASSGYSEALAFVDDLLIGERTANNPIHAASLRARGAEFEARLRRGLATLAYDDFEIARLCREFHLYLDALPGPGPEAPAEEAELAGSNGPMEDQPRPEGLAPELLSHLRGLRAGSWFEFRSGSGEPDRSKLSWISPASGRWMFVNWSGRKVAEVTPDKLAQQIESGLARVLPDPQLLKRALDSVLAELQLDGGEQSNDTRS